MAAVTLAGSTLDFALGQLTTAAGQTLSGLHLRYRVFGDLEAAAENGWILVFHALTGSAAVDSWWGPLLGPGKALDTTRHAVLAANLLGSCYGSSSPAEWRAEKGEKFPELAPSDLARAHLPLLEHLGIGRLALATGGSLGGMVALEWGRLTSVPTDRLVVFAAPGAASPQAIGWNAVQRMSIEADPAWKGGGYAAGEGPTAGLAAARALAMITYRSGAEFQARFGRLCSRSEGMYDVEHYLRRQGEKLVQRFDPASYVALMRTMDLHDIGDFAAAGLETSKRVGQVIGVGIDSDVLYLPGEVREWVSAYRRAGVSTEYREIASLYGHDAFLIEWEQVQQILRG
jgi:homoserine O-acetyltransferase/O-succinyltransferase